MKRDKNDIAHFILRVLTIIAPPVLLLIAMYVAIDPFDILRENTREQMLRNDTKTGRPQLHKGLVSLIALDERIARNDIPDTFIFGPSISCYYSTDTLMKLTDATTMPLHFDSSDEGVGSLRLKIEYLRRQGIDVKHALIIEDPLSLSSPSTGETPFSADPPAIGGLSTMTGWHYRHFGDSEYLLNYLPWLATGRAVNYSPREIFERQPYAYDLYRNEESIPQWDAAIRERPDSFYAIHRLPAERTLHCSDSSRIDSEHASELRLVRELLDGVDYHLVISPTLTLDTISSRDDALLRDIFGPNRYHNFSASMSRVALCDSNWYDSRHYREPVASAIMHRVYDHR